MTDQQPADDAAELKRAAYGIRASVAHGTAHVPDNLKAMSDAELSALWQSTAETDSMLDAIFDELHARGRYDICRSVSEPDGVTRIYMVFRTSTGGAREDRTDIDDVTAREIAMGDVSVTRVRVQETTADGITSSRDVWPPPGEWAREIAARVAKLDAENVLLRDALGIGLFTEIPASLELDTTERPTWRSAPLCDGYWLRQPTRPGTPVLVWFDEASGRVSLPALSLGFLKHEPGCIYFGPIALPPTPDGASVPPMPRGAA